MSDKTPDPSKDSSKAGGADYRDTVFLPKTDFPMRGDLPKAEPRRLDAWKALGLWDKMRAQSQGCPAFMLHDGPPYANGNIHIGHALNKILKDVVNRAQAMNGRDVHYIPGWDCHGLPIEWRIEEEYRKSGRNKDAVPLLDFRAECRAYADRWMAIQSDEFQRLGISGDWANRYATMDFSSEATIAREIGKFILNGALYRGLRPVMWSVVEKTALAEAEVEYMDHTSTSIWVAFPVTASPAALTGASIVIWTTTPWTMPGNRAIAYGPDITYVRITADSTTDDSLVVPGRDVVVAAPLLEKFLADTGMVEHRVVATYQAAELAGTMCAHPLRGQGYDFDVPLLGGDFVTTDQGTGFVHMAPAHGEDDFALCRQHGVKVPETVDDDGTYYAHVPLFAGVHVYKAADPVCDALAEAGHLLARGTLVHSYPHSWRSKKPLIFRATPQWFIRMDGPEQIRAAALDAIAATKFVPDQGRNRIGSMVAGRPDWCISRQRAWGVPIPVFVEKATGEVLRDADVIGRVVDAFRQEGADAWFASPAARFLGDKYDESQYEQVRDIVDVWFESGCTHAFTLEDRGLPWPADLYLEGSDQHRGWFQSSLLESIGTRGVAPYRAVLTHGFTLDDQGRKMSKSTGNVIAPAKVIADYGADILRLWVMNTDIAEDQRIGNEILKQQGELYRKLRNSLRWVLGGLDGFTDVEALPYDDLPELERLVLHWLADFDKRLRHNCDSHDWTGFYPDLHAFCASDLSAFYFDIRKDSLYCDAPADKTRRACRTVLDHLHRCLTTWLAPVLCFTADEAWTARFGAETSVHLEPFPAIPAQWHDAALATKWEAIRAHRRRITVPIENARREGLIGASLQADVTLALSPGDISLLPAAEWADIAIVSGVTLVADSAREAEEATVRRAQGEKCARCWRVLPDVGGDARHPALCGRCVRVCA